MVGFMKFRLSRKKHIPIFYLKDSKILDREWYPYEILDLTRTLIEKRKWRVADDGIRLEQTKAQLVLLPQHASLFAHEWGIWRRWYAPTSLKGKIVLDVGAGCGETAFFYFREGARKVICVEPDKAALECLEENAGRHSWNVEVLAEEFRVEMLKECRFDFMKMDGEGCEAELLKVTRLPTEAIVESHSSELTQTLAERLNAKVVANLDPKTSLLHIPRLISNGLASNHLAVTSNSAIGDSKLASMNS